MHYRNSTLLFDWLVVQRRFYNFPSRDEERDSYYRPISV